VPWTIKAAEAGKTIWFNPNFTFSAPFNIWMGLIGATVMVMSTHGAEQLIVQRVLACGNVSDGRKALALSAALVFPLFLSFLMVGVMLWVFYKGTGHPLQIPLPEARPGIKSIDFIFPIFMMTEVPHILKGFLIVAILSAAMSSISSAITSLASVSTMDFIKQMVKGRDEEYFLQFSKYSTVFWAGMLVLTAWLTREVTFVLNAAFSLRGLTAGALLGGLILALFWRRVGPRAAMAGMIASVVVMNFIYWPPTLELTRGWWISVFGATPDGKPLEVFWPWFTLIGTLVTLGVAAAMKTLWPQPILPPTKPAAEARVH
jgi:Na+/proline symporter